MKHLGYFFKGLFALLGPFIWLFIVLNIIKFAVNHFGLVVLLGLAFFLYTLGRAASEENE